MQSAPSRLAGDRPVPDLVTEIPGPKARAHVAYDETWTSTSLPRAYPIVPVRGQILATGPLPPLLGHVVLASDCYVFQRPSGEVPMDSESSRHGWANTSAMSCHGFAAASAISCH